jgi:hypothetical protein
MLFSSLRIGFIDGFSIENKFFNAFSSSLHEVEITPNTMKANSLTFNMVEIFNKVNIQ